jgi:hypothetical protein
LKARLNSNKNHKFQSKRLKVIQVNSAKVIDNKNASKLKQNSQTQPPKYDEAIKMFAQPLSYNLRQKRFIRNLNSDRNTLNSNMMFKVLNKKKFS